MLQWQPAFNLLSHFVGIGMILGSIKMNEDNTKMTVANNASFMHFKYIMLQTNKVRKGCEDLA
jgi:hypothetical protein